LHGNLWQLEIHSVQLGDIPTLTGITVSFLTDKLSHTEFRENVYLITKQ